MNNWLFLNHKYGLDLFLRHIQKLEYCFEKATNLNSGEYHLLYEVTHQEIHYESVAAGDPCTNVSIF
jgi:hypothetical protein